MRGSRRKTSGLLLGALVLLAGCYTRLVPVDGRPPPLPLPAPERPFASAGISLGKDSVTPRTAFFTAEDFAARFARRVVREGVFGPVVFPYPAREAAEPDVVLAVTVRMDEKAYYASNLPKAVLHVFTVFATLPLLPMRAGFAVDLSVTAFDAGRAPLASYAARSAYDVVYSWIELPHEAEDAWLLATADHAIEDVVNQMKLDWTRREHKSVRAGPSLAGRTR